MRRPKAPPSTAIGGAQLVERNRDRRPRRDAARNRDRLLEAAAEVFAEHGFDGGVAIVARTAGVAVGTLYRHFPTKESLINELVRDLLSNLLEEARDALDEPDGLGLEGFLRGLGEQKSSRFGALPRLWNTAEHADLIAEMRAATAQLLADAQRHGRVRAELVPTDVISVIWSIRGVIESTRGIAPDAWRRHLEVLLAGLAPSERPLTNEPLPEAAVDRAIIRRDIHAVRELGADRGSGARRAVSSRAQGARRT